MYNYKKKKGKLDKKDYWLYIYIEYIEKQKQKRMKNRGVPNPTKKQTYFGLSMDKGSSYVILFHYQP